MMDGYWNDLPCSHSKPFVCKAPYLSSPPGDLITTTPPPVTTACGEGWVEDVSTGTCYRVEDITRSFEDAQLHCEELYYSEGQTRPTLVSFTNKEEQIFVQGNLSLLMVHHKMETGCEPQQDGTYLIYDYLV